MRHRQFLLVLLCLLSATGFAQRSSSSVRPAAIPEMTILQPVGLVSSITQGNKGIEDPNASADAGEALRQALWRHEEKLHLKGQISLKDSALQRAAAVLITRAANMLEHKGKCPLPMSAPWLDSLLRAQNQRYCLLSYVWGYTRTASNSRERIAKDLGISLLTLGMAIPLSSRASTRVGVLIYDAQLGAIVYYKSSLPVDKDPLMDVVIDRELTDLLAKDFNLTDRI
jgi:hypothetical protein